MIDPRTLNRLILTTASLALLAALTGGAVRTLVGAESFRLVEAIYRLGALAAGLMAAAVLVTGRQALAEKRAVRLGLWAVGILAVPAALTTGSAWAWAAAVPHPGMAMLIAASWMTAALWAGGERSGTSRLAMFRSQWQVPLYAALLTYMVTLLGSYLKSAGSAAACTGWPLCADLLTGPFTPVAMAHLAHRSAAALAGLFLIYTILFVWRHHLNRPLILVLTGVSLILFATQVVLGAEAAQAALSPAGGFAHLLIAAVLISVLVVLSVVGYYAPSLPPIAGGSAAALAATPARPLGEVLRAYLMLTKPRILVLLLITGFAAMWVAAGSMPEPGLTLVTMIGLGMSCGAANAINMWYDRDIDGLMRRTKLRPIPAGLLTPAQALGFGILTGALSFVLLALAVNLLTAALSLAGLLFYVLIYTMWLKRSTDQNIVIGGAAGAIPPLVGWAAVTGSLSWAAVIMFLIVFVWTPPHFWALALFRSEDYKAAGVPMLPVVRGERQTRWQILLYTLLLIPTTLGLYLTGAVGMLYVWITLGAGLIYLMANLVLMFERLPVYKWAVRSFAWSILWLGIVFLAMMIDAQ